jgi:pyrrolysine biosynthesis protein PylC
MMTGGGPLKIIEGFFGADEAVSNYAPNRSEWAATLIISAENLELAWMKRNRVIKGIQEQCKLTSYIDSTPYSLKGNGINDSTSDR